MARVKARRLAAPLSAWRRTHSRTRRGLRTRRIRTGLTCSFPCPPLVPVERNSAHGPRGPKSARAALLPSLYASLAGKTSVQLTQLGGPVAHSVPMLLREHPDRARSG